MLKGIQLPQEDKNFYASLTAGIIISFGSVLAFILLNNTPYTYTPWNMILSMTIFFISIGMSMIMMDDKSREIQNYANVIFVLAGVCFAIVSISGFVVMDTINYQDDCIELHNNIYDIYEIDTLSKHYNFMEGCLSYMNEHPGSTGSQVVSVVISEIEYESDILDRELLP